VLGAALHAAFWGALILFAMTAFTLAARFASPDHEDDYSFSTLDELKKIPGYDPNFYNDISHEMYEDDQRFGYLLRHARRTRGTSPNR
jgi:hypothetical protein